MKCEIVHTKLFKNYLENLEKMTIYNTFAIVYDKVIHETDNTLRYFFGIWHCQETGLAQQIGRNHTKVKLIFGKE